MEKRITCTRCDKLIVFRTRDIVRAHKCFILCPNCNHANTSIIIDLAVEKTRCVTAPPKDKAKV